MAGMITAELAVERSWLPPLPSRSTRLMWYGDPVIARAELSAPQSFRVAMCAPQASTAFADVAVKPILMTVELSPSYAPVREYAETLLIVPLNIVNTWFQRPSSGLGCGSELTWGSGEIGNVVGGTLQPATPEHGSFPSTSVRLYAVR